MNKSLNLFPPQDTFIRYCYELNDSESVVEFYAFNLLRNKFLKRVKAYIIAKENSDARCLKCEQKFLVGETALVTLPSLSRHCDDVSSENDSGYGICSAPHGPEYGVDGWPTTLTVYYYHARCMTCAECDGRLDTYGIYFDEGLATCHDMYCGRHFGEKLKPRCGGCDELIFAEESLRAEDLDWHVDHFLCFMCHEPINFGDADSETDQTPYYILPPGDSSPRGSSDGAGMPVCPGCYGPVALPTPAASVSLEPRHVSFVPQDMAATSGGELESRDPDHHATVVNMPPRRRERFTTTQADSNQSGDSSSGEGGISTNRLGRAVPSSRSRCSAPHGARHGKRGRKGGCSTCSSTTTSTSSYNPDDRTPSPASPTLRRHDGGIAWLGADPRYGFRDRVRGGRFCDPDRGSPSPIRGRLVATTAIQRPTRKSGKSSKGVAKIGGRVSRFLRVLSSSLGGSANTTDVKGSGRPGKDRTRSAKDRLCGKVPDGIYYRSPCSSLSTSFVDVSAISSPPPALLSRSRRPFEASTATGEYQDYDEDGCGGEHIPLYAMGKLTMGGDRVAVELYEGMPSRAADHCFGEDTDLEPVQNSPRSSQNISIRDGALDGSAPLTPRAPPFNVALSCIGEDEEGDAEGATDWSTGGLLGYAYDDVGHLFDRSLDHLCQLPAHIGKTRNSPSHPPKPQGICLNPSTCYGTGRSGSSDKEALIKRLDNRPRIKNIPRRPS